MYMDPARRLPQMKERRRARDRRALPVQEPLRVFSSGIVSLGLGGSG